MGKPIRLNDDLLAYAKREGSVQHRSAPRQIELWALLGRAVENCVSMEDVLAVMQGIKRISVESVPSNTVAPMDILEEMESQDNTHYTTTAAHVYYEASQTIPGCIDRVDRNTGVRESGMFHNGEFVHVMQEQSVEQFKAHSS